MNPHMLMAAGRAAHHAINLASQRMGHRHTHALARLRAEGLEMIVNRVTGAQIIAMRDQFQLVIDIFVAEARHVMAERVKDKDAHRTSTDVVLRVELQSSIERADEQLAQIRKDAQELHSTTSMFLLKAGELLAEAGEKLGLSYAPVPLPQELATPPVIDVEADE